MEFNRGKVQCSVEQAKKWKNINYNYRYAKATRSFYIAERRILTSHEMRDTAYCRSKLHGREDKNDEDIKRRVCRSKLLTKGQRR